MTIRTLISIVPPTTQLNITKVGSPTINVTANNIKYVEKEVYMRQVLLVTPNGVALDVSSK